MPKFAVVKAAGKQYLVKKDDEIVVDNLKTKETANVELETLAIFDTDKEKIVLGTPLLKEKIKAKILKNLRGDKIKVAKFRAKVRYRKTKGFRPTLTKIKILNIV
ncbi:50S ribosomal protein L21 [Candidatus Roizmanbacteria bacterium]|nr:50S ribosomal protein L21 [Candidatus Roizmanbacteria bacterium]